MFRWHRDLHFRDLSCHRRRGALLGPLSEWPPAGAEIWNCTGLHHGQLPGDNEDSEALTADTCFKLVQHVRDWSSLAAASPDVLRHMSYHASVLEHWGSSLVEALGGHSGYMGNVAKVKFNADRLLKAIRLSLMIRGGSSRLSDIVCRSLALSLPPVLQASFLQCIP